jgi:Domain of unknown function (DUF3560)
MKEVHFTSGRTRDERRGRRSEGLRKKATRLNSESEAAHRQYKRHLPDPPDQPILIGHHSEKRHRSALKKADAAMRKAIELWKEAKETERLAQSAASNAAIRGTDADAVELLALRKAELERERDWRKAVNEVWRANGRPKPDNAEAWTAIAAALEEPLETLAPILKNMSLRYRTDTPPFPSWSFQNLGASIRRIAKRIEDVERAQTTGARPERRIGEVTVRDNPDYDTVELHFRGKPAPEVITLLRSHGFRWIHTARCWSRRGRNNTTEWKLGVIAKAIGKTIEPAPPDAGA